MKIEKSFSIVIRIEHKYPEDLPTRVIPISVVADTESEALRKAAEYCEEELYCSKLASISITDTHVWVM